MKDGGALNGAYGMALIAAAIYYLQRSDSFWNGVLGVVKAIFWPGVLVYKLLEFIKA